jgi:hypothetical protein
VIGSQYEQLVEIAAKGRVLVMKCAGGAARVFEVGIMQQVTKQTNKTRKEKYGNETD